MTEADLTAIEARDRARTSGEWHVEDYLDDYDNQPGRFVGFGPRRDASRENGGPLYEQDSSLLTAEDAAFIAACSTDVPALCAALRAAWVEVERLRARNAILEDRLEEWSR